MSDIRVKDLRRAFGRRGDIVAVDNVSFDVAPGEMLVLVGPSGCGKTTTLRCLAGLETPSAGSIAFGDQTVFDAKRKVQVPIHRRDIGLVFQNYALWPHLTAWNNIAFPLKSRGISRSERDKKITTIAEVVDLDPRLLTKHPAQLSGGQQQRVALARALVAEPQVVMFDEPLSNLDAALREQLRSEIRRLHEAVGFTGVYVTHDLSEAMLLGDRVAAMSDGSIVQVGTPSELFQEPANMRIARLMGYRTLGTLHSTSGRWAASDCDVTGPFPADLRSDTTYEMVVRAECISLGSKNHDDHTYRIGGGQLVSVGYLGGEQEVIVDFAGRRLRLITSLDHDLVPGESVELSVKSSDVRLFAAGDGNGVPAEDDLVNTDEVASNNQEREYEHS